MNARVSPREDLETVAGYFCVGSAYGVLVSTVDSKDGYRGMCVQ